MSLHTTKSISRKNLQKNTIGTLLAEIKDNNDAVFVAETKHIYHLVDAILKKSLQSYKTGNKKPYHLIQKKNKLIVQYPEVYQDCLDLDEWYQVIQNGINKYFYRKESNNSDIPEYYQQKRLFLKIDDKELEINGNIIFQGIPIHQYPRRTRQKKETKISPENQQKLEALKNMIHQDLPIKTELENKPKPKPKMKLKIKRINVYQSDDEG